MRHRPIETQLFDQDTARRCSATVSILLLRHTLCMCPAQSPGRLYNATALIKSCAVARGRYCVPVWRCARSEFVVPRSLPGGAVSRDNTYQML